jgi:hypothetical protein
VQQTPDVTFTTIEGRRLPLSQLRGRMARRIEGETDLAALERGVERDIARLS